MQALAAILTIVGDAFGNTAAKATIQSAAVEKTWESFGKGSLTLKAITQELQAQDATLDNVIARAPSIAALAEAFAQQETATRQLAQATIDLQKIEADRALAAELDQAMILAAKNKDLEAIAAIERATAAYDIKARGFAANEIKADQDVLAQKDANAKRIGEINAQRITDAGKLIDIENQLALAAVASGQAMEEAAFKAAKADADFFAVAVTGLEDYQAKRRAAIEATVQFEIDRITDSYTAQKTANEAILASLPYGGPAYQAAYAKGEQIDAEYNLAVTKASYDAAQKRMADDNTVTEERRVTYAANLATAEAHYQALANLGQEDVNTHVRFLQQAAIDENLSWTDRQKYAKAAYDERKAMAEANFNLLKALGLTTVSDEVANLARLASAYGANSKERIVAETEWATAAKKLREDVAAIGATLQDRALAALKEEGVEFATNAQIVQKINELRAQAIQDQTNLNAGGALELARFTDIRQLAGDFNEARKLGVEPSQAIADSTKLTLEYLTGATTAATELGGALRDVPGQLQLIGETLVGTVDPTRNIGAEIDAMMAAGRTANAAWLTENQGVLAEMKTQIEGLSVTTTSDILRPIGETLQQQFTDLLAAAPAIVQEFFTGLDALIAAGASKVGDRIYQGLIDRLKNAIDAEALAS
jgi:hypothetical protein